MSSAASFRTDVLIRLYDNQPIAVDSLGGTNELRMLVARYSVETGRTADEASILAALIDLRKKGKLPRKTDRPIKKITLETWPPYAELKRLRNGEPCYEVRLTHLLGFNDIMYAIYIHLMHGGKAPLSRLEAFEIIKEKVPEGYVFDVSVGDDASEDEWQLANDITQRLFPELATCDKDS